MSIEYLPVAYDESEDPIMLQTEEDFTLLLSTLVSQFPGACGLQYRNPDSRFMYGVRLSESRLHPPPEVGWGSKVLYCVFPRGLFRSQVFPYGYQKPLCLSGAGDPPNVSSVSNPRQNTCSTTGQHSSQLLILEQQQNPLGRGNISSAPGQAPATTSEDIDDSFDLNELMLPEVDPETLLEWLSMGHDRDMQLIAADQLCMMLKPDNVDRYFESCPPHRFLPALCRIFLDECSPENVLEVTARAIACYLDANAECTRRIVAMEGTVKAICNRLVVGKLASHTSKNLADLCVKLIALICTTDAGAVYKAGGLSCILTFIGDNGSCVQKDILHSAMAVLSRLCTNMEQQDVQLPKCLESLNTLLQHEDLLVADSARRCLTIVADQFTHHGDDRASYAQQGLMDELLRRLSSAPGPSMSASGGQNNPGYLGIPGASTTTDTASAPTTEAQATAATVSAIISPLSTLCRGPPTIAHDRTLTIKKIKAILAELERYDKPMFILRNNTVWSNTFLDKTLHLKPVEESLMVEVRSGELNSQRR